MAKQIHPTAIIEPGAELGEDVVIGAYAFVGNKAVIGDGTVLHHHANVEGRTTIGRQCEIFPFSCVGTKTHDLKYKGGEPGLVVGDRNVFREYVSVHGATNEADYTRMGDDNVMLAYSHIAHDCIVGDHVIFSNNGTLAGHVTVEDHAIVGGLTAVHQFCRIGRHAILGGCTKIVQDVPPFTIADGNPAAIRGINKVGLERHGFDTDAVRALREAYKILYRRDLNLSPALETIRSEIGEDHSEITELLAFIESSERGIIR